MWKCRRRPERPRRGTTPRPGSKDPRGCGLEPHERPSFQWLLPRRRGAELPRRDRAWEASSFPNLSDAACPRFGITRNSRTIDVETEANVQDIALDQVRRGGRKPGGGRNRRPLSIHDQSVDVQPRGGRGARGRAARDRLNAEAPSSGAMQEALAVVVKKRDGVGVQRRVADFFLRGTRASGRGPTLPPLQMARSAPSLSDQL